MLFLFFGMETVENVLFSKEVILNMTRSYYIKNLSHYRLQNNLRLGKGSPTQVWQLP